MRNNHAISRRAFVAGLGSISVLLSVPVTGYAASLPLVTVTKDPSCGCCTGWAEHVEAAGFPVRIVESQNMDAIKQRLGVPPALYSCHTAEVDGYVVEGHVPAAAIQRLLTERPAATGLVTTRLAPPAGFRRKALRHVHSDVVCDVSYARRGDAGRSSWY